MSPDSNLGLSDSLSGAMTTVPTMIANVTPAIVVFLVRKDLKDGLTTFVNQVVDLFQLPFPGAIYFIIFSWLRGVLTFKQKLL